RPGVGVGQRRAGFGPGLDLSQAAALVAHLELRPAAAIPGSLHSVRLAVDVWRLRFRPQLAAAAPGRIPQRDRAIARVVALGDHADPRPVAGPEDERAGPPALRECADHAQSAVGLIELVSTVRYAVAPGADRSELLRTGAGGQGRQRECQAAPP